MLAEIENAAAARLKEKAPEVPVLDSAKGEDILTAKVAVIMAIQKGPAVAVAQETKQEVELSLWVAFKNIKNDKDRRHGAFPVVESLAQLLNRQTLGLAIKPLRYGGFLDVTAEQEREAGLAVYQVDFRTSYVMEPLPEEEAQDLLRVGLNYLLDGSANAAAQDVVELRPEPGGE